MFGLELYISMLNVIEARDETLPESLLNGDFVRYLCHSKLELKAREVQERIVEEDDQNDRERYILLKLLVELKADDDKIKNAFEVFCL